VPTPRVGYLGPPGTFTEQALLTQDDLAKHELVAMPTIADVLAATSSGVVDLGFAAIENMIEGTVTVTLDTLALESSLLIQREVVLRVQMVLMAPPGETLDRLHTVMSIPIASAQCRGFIGRVLPGVTLQAANSTAEAAQIVGERREPGVAAIGPALAAEIYGLDVLATDIEDHGGNETRFVVVAREGVPAPTGHDKTTVVCFQRDDRPGSLLAMLQEFAARSLNLSKLESRPTKRGLGDYCFIMDIEGHIADEVVADALRALKEKAADVRFLGSYPAAGDHGPAVRRDAEESRRSAERWVADLRGRITP